MLPITLHPDTQRNLRFERRPRGHEPRMLPITPIPHCTHQNKTQSIEKTHGRKGTRTPIFGFGDRRSTLELFFRVSPKIPMGEVGIEPTLANSKLAALPLGYSPWV